MSKAEELKALKEQIDAMSPGDKLRLAAGLMDAKEPAKLRLALTIARDVVSLGDLALMRHDMKPR